MESNDITWNALSSGEVEPAVQVWWMERLFGPVYRLARDGEDREDDRKRCWTHLEGFVKRAMEVDGDARTVGALLDWWATFSLGRGVVHVGWQMDDYVEPWLANALRGALRVEGPGTSRETLLKPVQLRRAREHLKELAERPTKFNKAPGPEIFKEAQEEARQLVALSRHPGAEAPTDLHILTEDTEEWASKRRGQDALTPKLKVWNKLHRRLSELQDAARHVVETWTEQQPGDPFLPMEWEARVRAELPHIEEFVRAVLWDLASLDPDADQGSLPRALDPRWLLDEFRTIPSELPMESRVRMLAVVREALEADPSLTAPDWLNDASDHLESLRTQIRGLRARAEGRGNTDAGEQLTEALNALGKLEIGETQQWIQWSEETLSADVRDAETDRLEKEAAGWLAELEEIGQRRGLSIDSGDESTLQERHGAVHEQWEKARSAIVDRWESLSATVDRFQPGAAQEQAIQRLQATAERLKTGRLGAAHRTLEGVSSLIEAERRATEERLRPELRKLWRRVEDAEFRGLERQSVRALVQRIEARADAELEHRTLVRALESLVEAIEQDRASQLRFLGIVVEAAGLHRRRRVELLCWLDTGVEVDPVRFGDLGIQLPDHLVGDLRHGELCVVGGSHGWYRQKDEAPILYERPEAVDGGLWHDMVPTRSLGRVSIQDIREYPGAEDLSPTYLITAEGAVQGPYSAGDDALTPADPRGFVARMDANSFADLFGILDVAGGATRTAPARRLIQSAPTLDEMLAEDAEPVDQADPLAVEMWLADLAGDLDPEAIRGLAQAIATLEDQDIPRLVLEHRMERLREFLETSRLFQQERRRAAEIFIATEEGQREVQRAASRRVEEEIGVVRQQVDQRRKELEAQLADLQLQIEGGRNTLDELAGAAERQSVDMESQVLELQEELGALEELRVDRRSKLLAELLGASSNWPPVGRQVKDTPAATPAGALQATHVATRHPRTLSGLLEEISGRLDAWDPQEVANLLACLITSPWTLLAGAPGTGKSTFVRSMVEQLGHGPGTGRYLELVVRRDWQDDSPLFGFWHPQKGAWESSSEGFAELLLTAADDQANGHGGLYCAVLEELNLASPEYYLARPISALEARVPTIRLYGDELATRNADRYPASFPLASSVRLLGTVNIDDTVERLSPRFLSRVQVLWMEPSLDAFRRPLNLPDPPDSPVDWSAIEELSRGLEPQPTDNLLQVVDYLHAEKVPGAPSPRTMRGMERYMSVARELMPIKVAEDHQILQRILPCIRGVGARYRKVLEELMAICSGQGWRLSAARCEQIRERGEELGDFYDFFHC